MGNKQKPTTEELRDKLTEEQFEVTQESGTEPAFSGKYNNHKATGTYICVCCESKLFSSYELIGNSKNIFNIQNQIEKISVTESRDFEGRRLVRLEGVFL